MADTEKRNDKDLAPENCCDAKRDGLFCTLPKGHKGEHIAEGSIGRVYARWPQPDQPSPPSTDLAGEAAEKCLRFIEDSDYTTADEGRGGLEAIISEVIAPLEAELAGTKGRLTYTQDRLKLITESEQRQYQRAEAAEGKLREGIPPPQRLSREQLIEKAREHFKGLDYPIPEEIADFTLSLNAIPSRGQFVAELLGLWAKALRDEKIREAYKGAWQEIKTAISVLAKTYSADELDVTPSGDGQKERKPDGYAYRYHDCIRFNHGQMVNGGEPIEAIPYYFGAPPAEQSR